MYGIVADAILIAKKELSKVETKFFLGSASIK
jgi:hypothetical protein